MKIADILIKINEMIFNIQIQNITYHSSSERKAMMSTLVTLKKFINKWNNNDK